MRVRVLRTANLATCSNFEARELQQNIPEMKQITWTVCEIDPFLAPGRSSRSFSTDLKQAPVFFALILLSGMKERAARSSTHR